MRGYLFMVMLLLNVAATAQERSFNGWLAPNAEYPLGGQWRLYNEAQLRSTHQWKYTEVILLRPALLYALTQQQTLGIGYTYFGTWEYNDQETNFQLEHRLFEQYSTEARWGKGQAKHRVRLEQRWLLYESKQFAQRLRYNLRYTLPLGKHSLEQNGWYGGLQNEIFLNVQNKERTGGSVYDQNRLFTFIGLRFTKRAAADVGYLYRHQVENDQKNHNHILQLSLALDIK